MERLPLTHKLVQHVRTPFVEIATVTMTNQEPRFIGAAFCGHLTPGRNGAIKTAYAGVFDPVVPQPTRDAYADGALAGTFRPPSRPHHPDVLDCAQRVTTQAAKHVEYLIQSGTTKESRTMYRGSDLMTQALSVDAKLTENSIRDISFDYGCRAAWLVARDVRNDDAADPELQRVLTKLRSAGAPPIPQDILPPRSHRYSAEENEDSRREEIIKGNRALPPLEVEVQIANIGDCRAFGVLRRGARVGGRSEDDPEYHAESFGLRYARDLGTELPGWHGKETTDAHVKSGKVLPDQDRAVKAKAAPKPPAGSLHEPAEQLGLTAESYALPPGTSVDGPIDPLFDLNAVRPFHTQEEAYRERRARLVPLSADQRPSRTEERIRIQYAKGSFDQHRHALSITPPPADPKTGRVDRSATSESKLDDNALALPVSRLLGFHRLKQNPELSAVEQIVSPLPDIKSWSMSVGDIVVLSTHALFETRSGLPTTVDSLVEVVLESFARRRVATGAPGDESDGVVVDVARDLCDFAVRFGAPRNLAVTVLRCRELTPAIVPGVGSTASKMTTPGIGNSADGYSRSSHVLVGTLYPGALRASPRFRDVVLGDAARLGLTLEQLLMYRYKQTAKLHREIGTLASCTPLKQLINRYPSEAGLLSAVLVDEADFFRACPFAPDDIDPAAPTQAQTDFFVSLAKFIELPSVLES